MKVLFVCSRNRLRSPTAEEIFATVPGWEVQSAGVSPDAEVRLTAEMVEWADVVFVMEEIHRAKLNRQFGSRLRAKRIVCLNISDEYEFMQPELIELLKRRVSLTLSFE